MQLIITLLLPRDWGIKGVFSLLAVGSEEKLDVVFFGSFGAFFWSQRQAQVLLQNRHAHKQKTAYKYLKKIRVVWKKLILLYTVTIIHLNIERSNSYQFLCYFRTISRCKAFNIPYATLSIHLTKHNIIQRKLSKITEKNHF